MTPPAYLAHRRVLIAVITLLSASAAGYLIATLPLIIDWIITMIDHMHDSWRDMGWELF
jgi:hypothetical protein